VTEDNGPLADLGADAIVTFGGDGTLLNVARRLDGAPVPVLGIHVGRLGYLAALTPGEMLQGLGALLDDEVRVTERMMLACTLPAQARARKCRALNDVLVATRGGRMVELEIEADDRPLISLRGDGVIVATPTGSTAHSMSAGGPILSPELRAVVLTPVCPHELANRPLVVSDAERLRIRLAADSPGARAAVDGEYNVPLDAGDEVVVQAAQACLRLVEMPGQGRYTILRRKLGWGGSARPMGPADAEGTT